MVILQRLCVVFRELRSQTVKITCRLWCFSFSQRTGASVLWLTSLRRWRGPGLPQTRRRRFLRIAVSPHNGGIAQGFKSRLVLYQAKLLSFLLSLSSRHYWSCKQTRQLRVIVVLSYLEWSILFKRLCSVYSEIIGYVKRMHVSQALKGFNSLISTRKNAFNSLSADLSFGFVFYQTY